MKKLFTTLALSLTIAGLHAQQTAESPLLAKNMRISLTGKYLPEDASSAEAPHDHYRHYGHRRTRSLPTGSNVLSGSPVNLTVVNSYACFSFGFTYEHLFGPDQIIGLQVPVHFAFGTNNILYDDDKGNFYYATPGLQVHVAGARHGFDYALGPSVLLGNLYERTRRYNSNGYYYNDKEQNTFTTGIVLDNNLNFQRRAFLFGLHLGLGTTFPNSKYDSQFFFQFGIRFGGRF